MSRARYARAVLGSLALIALARTSQAQGAIDGIVTDTSLAPLSGATVSVIGSALQVTTNANGRFRMLALTAGQYVLIAQKLGYAPVTQILVLTATDTLRPAFELARNVRTLDTVT